MYSVMKVLATTLPGIEIIEPDVFEDERGFFFESFNERRLAEQVGIRDRFVQDNHSLSRRNVLRGLHYQIKYAQGKLVRVVTGEVFDVAVDLRRSSPTFGQWVGLVLSADNRRQLWIAKGFAHGFLVLSDFADLLYKTTDYHYPEYDRCLYWNDPQIGIGWPLSGQVPLLSPKDEHGKLLNEAERYP